MLTYVAVDQISTCAAHTLRFFTAKFLIDKITKDYMYGQQKFVVRVAIVQVAYH